MKKKHFGIVIKVKNLTTCKVFYRDVLGLGDPVLDSNFRVEFQIDDSFCLILEKISSRSIGSSFRLMMRRAIWLFGL